MNMKQHTFIRFIAFTSFALGATLLSALTYSTPAAAAYDGGKLIDNAVFLNANTMDVNAIQSFLVSKGGGLASKSFYFNCAYDAQTEVWYRAIGAPCGSTVSAATIIYYAGQVYGINPQVIIATLQKEQSLITTVNPTTTQINYAMGYGCPDNGSCTTAGFFEQVDMGTWTFRFNYERASGNYTWWKQSYSWVCDTSTRYYSPTLLPYRNVNFYDDAGVMYRTHYIANAATSALYCYTPHAYNNPYGLYGREPYGTVGMYYSGSYNFVYFFEMWFRPADAIRSGMTMTILAQPDASPARGQTVTYTMSYKNQMSTALTFSAVGVVGRANNPYDGPNRDFGWVGPVTIQPGETKQFTFTRIISDVGSLYAWPALAYDGSYIHYNNWGASLTSREPNFSLAQPVTLSAPSLSAGQTATLNAVVKNNEPQPIAIEKIGIPVRYYNTYQYDTAWLTPQNGTLAPGGTQTLSGSVTFDKEGPYTTSVAATVQGATIKLGSETVLTAEKATPNFTLNYIETPHQTPAIGQEVKIQFKLKNNRGVPMQLDAVGVVGRYGNPYTGANRDWNWVGPEQFGPYEEKSYTTFVSTVSELQTFYAWVAIKQNNTYIHYNTWGFMLQPHAPNLSLSAPLRINDGVRPSLGQTVPVTATVKNNEPFPIRYNGLGVAIRYYDRYVYDTGWTNSGTLAPAGQAGDTVQLTGSVTFDKAGPYTAWVSANIQDNYFTLSPVQSFNY
jgi:hypothetical protein